MEITFLSESGRPGFSLRPISDNDYEILKQFMDWQAQFPDDKFMIRNSSWSDGLCHRVSIGFQKPYESPKPNIIIPDPMPEKQPII